MFLYDDFIRFFPEYMMNTVSLHELVKKMLKWDDSTTKKITKGSQNHSLFDSTSSFYAFLLALSIRCDGALFKT